MAADSGMETCPSPEIADSRKRPLDCDVENGSTKRSHYGTGKYHPRLLPRQRLVALGRPTCLARAPAKLFEVRSYLVAPIFSCLDIAVPRVFLRNTRIECWLCSCFEIFSGAFESAARARLSVAPSVIMTMSQSNSSSYYRQMTSRLGRVIDQSRAYLPRNVGECRRVDCAC